MKRLITLLGLLTLSCTAAMATHLASAEIRYEYTGNANDYKVTLRMLRACEPGASTVGTWARYIDIESSCFAATTDTLSFESVDTLGSYCAGTFNSCSIINAPVYGYEQYTFSGIVSLPPCADWTLSYSECCRNGGIVNLSNPSGYSIYVESTLNNAAAINTSAQIPNPPSATITSGVTSYVPMQVIDAENDSLVIEWYNPLDAGVNTPVNIPYEIGYSLANPFGSGGTAAYDMANQVMILKSPSVGKYALALKVTEYRNGIMVGSTQRDFNVVSLPSGAALTYPTPAAGSNFNYTTCPGQANIISINFEDSTATDSVYLTVTTPTIPGFTFTSTTTAAPGTANVTISWTTPSSLNPATLPQFYFMVDARDNNCPINSLASYAIAVHTAQCNTDSVWAGDANGDYTVNIYDPLAISVAYGETGAIRAGATTNWQAEYCAPWGNTFLSGVDMKHADCNGDGIVDNTDLSAVTANWGLTHMRGNSTAKTTGIPSLYFDANGIQFIPGTTVNVPIMLGDAGSVVNDFYGLGATIQVSGIALANQPAITYPANSWLGSAANTLRYTRNQTANIDMVDWVYARTDHQNVSNSYGQIATLSFDIPVSTPVGTQIELQFANAQFINKDMSEMTDYSTVDTTVITPSLNVEVFYANKVIAQVVPNPSGANANLQITLATENKVSVQIADATGRTIWQQQVAGKAGMQQVALPQVASGIYFIRYSADNDAAKTIKWMRN